MPYAGKSCATETKHVSTNAPRYSTRRTTLWWTKVALWIAHEEARNQSKKAQDATANATMPTHGDHGMRSGYVGSAGSASHEQVAVAAAGGTNLKSAGDRIFDAQRLT